MKWKYPVLLRSGGLPNKVIYVPDLDLEKEITEEEIENIGLAKTIQNLIMNRIHDLELEGYFVVRPKKIKDYDKIKKTLRDIWFNIEIESVHKKGFFENFLPVIVITFRVISVGLVALLTFFAMEISTNSNKPETKLLSAFVSLSSFLMAMVMFIFSNAKDTIGWLGNKIDNLFLCKQKKAYQSNALKNNQNKCCSTVTILKCLTYVGLGTLVINDSISYGITSAQSIKALGEKLLENNFPLSNELIFILFVITLVSTTSSTLVFDTGFTVDALSFFRKKIENKFNNSPSKDSPPSEINEPLSSTQKEHMNELEERIKLVPAVYYNSL